MPDDRDEQFEVLYRYYPAVYKTLTDMGFSRDDARELAQDVFVRVYASMDQYQGKARAAYLTQIARNLGLNRIRDMHANKRAAIHVDESALVSVPDPALPADVAFQRKQRSQRLREAVERLDDKLKSCVLLYLRGLSYEEIQQTLGISEPALKSRLHVARDRLREFLGEPEGWDEP